MVWKETKGHRCTSYHVTQLGAEKALGRPGCTMKTFFYPPPFSFFFWLQMKLYAVNAHITVLSCSLLSSMEMLETCTHSGNGRKFLWRFPSITNPSNAEWGLPRTKRGLSGRLVLTHCRRISKDMHDNFLTFCRSPQFRAVHRHLNQKCVSSMCSFDIHRGLIRTPDSTSNDKQGQITTIFSELFSRQECLIFCTDFFLLTGRWETPSESFP